MSAATSSSSCLTRHRASLRVLFTDGFTHIYNSWISLQCESIHHFQLLIGMIERLSVVSSSAAAASSSSMSCMSSSTTPTTLDTMDIITATQWGCLSEFGISLRYRLQYKQVAMVDEALRVLKDDVVTFRTLCGRVSTLRVEAMACLHRACGRIDYRGGGGGGDEGGKDIIDMNMSSHHGACAPALTDFTIWLWDIEVMLLAALDTKDDIIKIIEQSIHRCINGDSDVVAILREGLQQWTAEESIDHIRVSDIVQKATYDHEAAVAHTRFGAAALLIG